MPLEARYVINDQVCLTEIRTSDKAAIIKHINDYEIYINTLHIPFPYYESDAEEFLAVCRKFEEQFQHVAHYAIRLQGEMIGGIGFLYAHGENSHKAEIGYWLGAAHRRKGLTTLAIKKIVEIGFNEKGLFRLEANVFTANIASMKALKNAGFEQEGLMKSTYIKGDELVDSYRYAIVREN